MNSRLVIRALKADGWYEVRQVGSHKQFKHPRKRGTVTVVDPARDIPLKNASEYREAERPQIQVDRP